MRPMWALTQVLCVCAVLFAGCARLNWFKRPDTLAVHNELLPVGTPAPELQGHDVNGKHFNLSDQRGNVVVVVFWASWCGPCCQMIPHERSLVERYRDKPFVMVSVNNDSNFDDANRAIASHKITWPCLCTGSSSNPINQGWKVNALPTVYVIDGKGIIRHAYVGRVALDQDIEKLLAER